MTEPVKVLPMAKLLRLAREKEEREREAGAAIPDTPEADSTTTQTDSIPTQTIPQQTIVQQTPVPPTILSETIVSGGIDETAASPSKPKARKSPDSSPKGKADKSASDSGALLDISKGYFPSYNDLSDRLIPELGLNPFEQSVLQRLYRLSRGWRSDECEVGLGTLAKFCVMSRSQVQRSIAGLIDKGVIVNLGPAKKGSKDGNRYRVLPDVSAIPSQTMVSGTIVPEDVTLFSQNTVVRQSIVSENTIKNSNKDILNTHTHTEPGVRVGSRYTLEECRAFAESLRTEGIQNPGGYATTIHRSGEADDRIEAFLKQQPIGPGKPGLDAEQIQEQANLVASMLRQGTTLEEVERQLATKFRPAQWRMIRSIALAQASAYPPNIKKQET